MKNVWGLYEQQTIEEPKENKNITKAKLCKNK